MDFMEGASMWSFAFKDSSTNDGCVLSSRLNRNFSSRRVRVGNNVSINEKSVPTCRKHYIVHTISLII